MKNFVIVFMSFMIFLNGCSNSQMSDKIFHEENLLDEVNSLKSEYEWTGELEKNRLAEKINSIDYIDKKNMLTSDTFLAFEAGVDRPILYPLLDGFGSLDISDTDANAIAIVNTLCNSLIAGSECEYLFEQNSIFTLVLFMNDTEGFNFASSSFYVGKGYVDGGAVEIPVRMTTQNGLLEFHVYLKEIQLLQNEATSEEENASQAQNSLGYKIVDLEIKKLDN